MPQRPASGKLWPGNPHLGGQHNWPGSPSACQTPVSNPSLTISTLFHKNVKSNMPYLNSGSSLQITSQPQPLLSATLLKPEAGWPSRLPAFSHHLLLTVSVFTIIVRQPLLVPHAALRALPSAWDFSHCWSPSPFSGSSSDSSRPPPLCAPSQPHTPPCLAHTTLHIYVCDYVTHASPPSLQTPQGRNQVCFVH